MSAERGPSGTGHDTAGTVCPKCGMLGAAFVTHVCMTAGEVPDPPATRWLNPPPDPPVAVPGPASARPHRLRLLWNHLQAKLHHAYPCRKCGYAYNCPDGECHS